MNANDSRNSITKTDVMSATALFSFINDSNNQLKRSDSDEDNDEEN
jgi:hypothetical protein